MVHIYQDKIKEYLSYIQRLLSLTLSYVIGSGRWGELRYSSPSQVHFLLKPIFYYACSLLCDGYSSPMQMKSTSNASYLYQLCVLSKSNIFGAIFKGYVILVSELLLVKGQFE